MSPYTATATPWEHGWELAIFDEAGNEFGATQSHGLHDAEYMVRNYVHAKLDVPEETVTVALTVEVPDVSPLVQEAKAKTRAAERAQLESARLQRSAVAKLLARGITGNDVARVLGVSKQRVSQLRKWEVPETVATTQRRTR